MEKVVVDIEFKTNIAKAQKDLEKVKESVSGIGSKLDGIDKTGKKGFKGLKKGLTGIGKGFKGVGLAMKTMGIGLVIEAFNFLKEILKQNESVMSGVAIVTETIGVFFNQLVSVVTDVWHSVSKSSEGFEGLQEVLGGALTLTINNFKLTFFAIKLAIQEGQLAWEQSFFGDGNPETIERLNSSILETRDTITEVANSSKEAGQQIMDNIGEAITEVGSAITTASESAIEGVKNISVSSAIETGKALALAKSQLELIEVLRAKQQFQSQLDAELQRQVRDDITKTFEERIKANDELGKILDEQLEKEQFSAQEKVRIALLELDANKDNMDNKVKYQKALLEQLDLEERIAGMRSEQLTNQVALEIEQAEAVNTLKLATMTAREQELESLKQDYDAKLELARKSGMETEAITIQYNALVNEANERSAKEDFEITKTFDDKKKAQRQANVDALGNTLNMAGKLFEGNEKVQKKIATASAIMDTWKSVNVALASAPPPLSYIQAGLSLVTGLKSVKEINKVKTSGGGGGGGSGGGNISASLPSGSAGGGGEQLADLSNIPSLTEQFNDQFGNEQPPIQAYVVEQEVTNSQQINTMIQDKATL